MRAVDLSDSEAELVAAGLCACGCGEPIPPGSRRDRITAKRACRNRLHRKRQKTGRAMSEDGRRRVTLERAAIEDDCRAAELEEQARKFVRRAEKLRARARRRREEAWGTAQLSLQVGPRRSLQPEEPETTPGNP